MDTKTQFDLITLMDRAKFCKERLQEWIKKVDAFHDEERSIIYTTNGKRFSDQGLFLPITMLKYATFEDAERLTEYTSKFQDKLDHIKSDIESCKDSLYFADVDCEMRPIGVLYHVLEAHGKNDIADHIKLICKTLTELYWWVSIGVISWDSSDPEILIEGVTDNGPDCLFEYTALKGWVYNNTNVTTKNPTAGWVKEAVYCLRLFL